MLVISQRCVSNTYHGLIFFFLPQLKVQNPRTTPYKVVYGHDPPLILRFSNDTSIVEAVNEKILLNNQTLDTLMEHLLLA